MGDSIMLMSSLVNKIIIIIIILNLLVSHTDPTLIGLSFRSSISPSTTTDALEVSISLLIMLLL